ncbi:MAG: hypothetical protein N2Z84_04920 [Atribacterota bacterium]|nr:hypothetical protein [Atribacterota bacterium]
MRLAQITGNQEVEEWVRAFEKLMQKIGLRTRFREFGIPEEALISVLRPERIGASIRENPRSMGTEDLYSILKEVY